ncbi:kinesin-like protein KIF15 isoform X2 [Nematostella vectensis]|uniref:kinesin-like protein KIF15 isoform X2 n=1 Tax=Nematostella vectensis TaxID=45351 RepID=UPI002076FEDA|nr:kinesin-like protein KIF15 isoform X2 [Nematostella vectensis]XP_048576585.1 kinesin-like protein KIF15 isoform X2 [Nematostella vectensis]
MEGKSEPKSNAEGPAKRKSRHGESGGYESSEGDNIKVYVRVRPPAENLESGVDRTPCIEVTSANSLLLHSRPEPKTFSFDHVADTNTMQEEVFGAVAKNIVEGCVDGYNGTIFAYGQTGSGKTFTMLGPAEGEAECFTHELRGVIPRCFEYLFSLIKREQEKHGDHLEFLCQCSFLEIYNEQIFDLLDPASSGLALREDLKKGIFVCGLLERDVTSAKEAYNVLNSGWLNRRVASTSMNRESSRSHAVFTVTLQSREKKNNMSNIKVSRLHLVDLAGSERQRDTHAEGLRLKEASSINKSLSALGNVIMALVDITHGKNRHIHYRDSKLTFLLRDSLGGNARTYIIANVHPSAKCFGETLSTLNFARRAKMIKNKAVINEDSTGSVIALQAEIKKLREEVSRLRAGAPIPIREKSTPDNDAALQRQNSSDGNNNEYSQQYREWKEMILAATEARERAEQEKLILVEKVQKLEELCSKKDKFVMSTKMILKFRESHIAKLERMRKSSKEDLEKEEDTRDQQIQLLKEEISMLKEQVEHHPDVTRFAMQNLELRAEVKRLRTIDNEGNDITTELAKSHRYTYQLEQQLRNLLKSPQGSVDLERSLSSSLLNLEASNAELEKYKIERGQMMATLDSTREDLEQTRESLQQLKEKHVNESEGHRRKIVELEAGLSSSKKTISELERALDAYQLKTAMERTTLNEIHMQTIKTLTSPRKSPNSKRLTPQSAAKSKRGNPLTPRGNDINRLNSPVISLDEEKPPSWLKRRDSFHDTSDSEFDEPFFDFEGDDMDAEEIYSEALMDELKKLQDMNNDCLQKLQAEEAKAIRLSQTATKLDHQVQQLNNILTSEREKFAAAETELNLRNLSLTDKLKEAKGKNTILGSEVEDLKIVLQSADKELEYVKKQRDLESIEVGRKTASLESQVTKLEIENYNKQNEIESGIESIQNLQSEVETLRAELEFNQHKTDQYEELLKSERQRIRSLEQELQSTNEKLHFQTETNMNLMSTQDVQEERVRALEQCQTLQAELQKSNAQCEQQAYRIMAITQDLEECKGMVNALNKRNESDKDCVNNLMESVKGLKKVVSEKEAELGARYSELEETRSRVQELNDTLSEKERTIDKLKEKLGKEAEKINRERQQWESETSTLREDLKRTSQQCIALAKALEEQQQQYTAMQADLSSKADMITQLEDKNVKLVQSMADQEASYESRVMELQNVAQSGDSSIVIIESQSNDLEHYKATQDKLKKALESYELDCQAKNKEITSLRATVETMEELQQDKHRIEAINRELQEALDHEAKLRKESEEKHSNAIKELLLAVKEATEKATSAQQDLQSMIAKSEKWEQALAEANFNRQNAEESAEEICEELERTRELEAQMFEEKEELKSKCEKLKEEKLKMEQTIQKLGDENAKLVGHQNPQQKVQYLLSLKRDNNELRQEISKLVAEQEKCTCGDRNSKGSNS